MRVWIVVVAALLAAAGLSPRAAAEVTDPTRMVDRVTIELLTEVIRELGGKDIRVQEADGQKSITFVDANVPYNVTLALCKKANPGECYGFGVLVLMQDANYSWEVLNKTNQDTMLVTVFKDEEPGKLGVARVELTLGGVTKKHVAEAITWFVIDLQDMLKALGSQVTAEAAKDGKNVALIPTPRPVAATPQEIARLSKRAARPYEERNGFTK